MTGLMVFLHILGAAIWAGGLIFVGLTAGVARRTIPPAERIEFFRRLGLGFLGLAGIAAALIAMSGNLLVEEYFGGWGNLGDTEVGGLIAWKSVLFLIVLGLALLHALVLGPRTRRLREREVAGEAGEGDAAALRRTAILSGVAQVLMLGGTIAILALAADMIS